MPNKELSESVVSSYRAAFPHGEIVMLKTDPDMLPRIVKEHCIYMDGSVMYGLRVGDETTSYHMEGEIRRLTQKEQDLMEGGVSL